jgi:hypothetical protein
MSMQAGDGLVHEVLSVYRGMFSLVVISWTDPSRRTGIAAKRRKRRKKKKTEDTRRSIS